MGRRGEGDSHAMRAILIAGVLALGLGPAAGVHGQTASGGVVARVNGEAITSADMSMFYESLPAEFRQASMDALYGQLLEGLIDRKLLALAAREAGLLDDETVKERLAYVEDGVLQEVYLGQVIDAEVNDQRLRAAYEALIASQAGNQEVHARHILLDSEDDAKAVIAALEAGADFAETARRRSTGPSAPNGGDLGYFTKEQMVPAFADAAFGLDAGAITTQPVETQFGWHVIKLEDRRAMAPPSFEALQVELRNQETQAAIIELMRKLYASSSISRFDAKGDPMAAPVAGGGAQ